MKILKKLNDFSDKCNKAIGDYTPSAVVKNGTKYEFIAEKKIGFFKRIGTFFNFKLLKNNPNTWKEAVKQGKKYISLNGDEASCASINLALLNVSKRVLFGALVKNAIANDPKSKDPYAKDYNKLDDPIADNSKEASESSSSQEISESSGLEEQKEILDGFRNELMELANNPHIKKGAEQPLVDHVSELDYKSLEVLYELKLALAIAVQNPADYENKDTKGFFKMDNADDGSFSISLNTRFTADHQDRCLVGRERVDLEYHDVQALVQNMVKEMKDDSNFTIYATQ